MTEEKKRGSGILGFIMLLLIAYLILAIVDYFGIFVKGSYSNNNDEIILAESGNMPGEKGNFTYTAFGKDFIIYKDGEKYLEGTIQNGVISYSILGIEINYYKNGDTSLDRSKKTFTDYIRIIVSPLSKLIYDIAH